MLHLSSSNSSIATFEYDVNVSATPKREVLKFLSVILKNLLKSDDPKFRQLRLGNAKIQRLTAHAAVSHYLKQTVGFENCNESGESLLRIPSTREPSREAVEAALQDVSAAHDRVDSLLPKVSTASRSTTSSSSEQLSLKQKSRKLLEEQQAAEKEEARLARKRTVSQIKADKFVRENDPNWKPTISAAAAKTGDTMQTFRDKFGES